MRKLMLALPLIFFGCTISQKITYKTDELSKSPNAYMIPAKVAVKVLKDNRENIEENAVLFDNPRQIKLNGEQTCINSEKHYKKDTVVNQITKIMVAHFNEAKLFEKAYYQKSEYSGYYLSGKLNRFYAEQKFSTGAAVGASFGLIGALATSGIKTPGKIIINISDLKLFNQDGTLVKDFGNFYKEYNNDFQADAYCWCAYWNANEKLKEFNTHLIEKIRNDLAETELK